MQLSDETLARLAGPTPARAADPDDRRKAPRNAACAGATLHGYRDGEISTAMPVGLKDLSPAGLCVMQYRPLRPGQRFIVELPTTAGEPVRMLCTVRYCRMLNEELYAMGASFDAPWTGALAPGRADPDAIAA